MSNLQPMPRGKMLPSLVGSYNYNSKDTPSYLVMSCPACGSENVCCLSDKYNPELDGLGRWFCISCQESWEYESY